MDAKQYVSAVVGVYPDSGQAQDAFEKLKHAGISPDDISLVGSEDDLRQAQRGYYYPPAEVLGGAARAGAVRGAQIGAVTGLLTGLVTFLLPGLGVFGALGALTGMLGGAGIGVAVGGPLGAAGFQDDAIAYRTLLTGGNMLLVVHCATAEEERHAHAVLSQTSPRDLHIVPRAG